MLVHASARAEALSPVISLSLLLHRKYLLIREVLLLSVVYTTTLGGLSSTIGNPATRILLQYIEQYVLKRTFLLGVINDTQ